MGWTKQMSISGRGKKISLLQKSQTALRPSQLVIWWVAEVLSLQGKWLRCQADHSLPSIADIMNEWNCTSTSPYISMAWIGTHLPLHIQLCLW